MSGPLAPDTPEEAGFWQSIASMTDGQRQQLQAVQGDQGAFASLFDQILNANASGASDANSAGPEPGASAGGSKPTTGGSTTGGQNAGDVDRAEAERQRRQDATEYAKANFAWAYKLGLGSLIEDAVQRGVGGPGLVAEIRNSDIYKNRFTAILRPDGTMRMNEAEYLAREDDYRTLFKQYGHGDPDNMKPADFAAYFNGEVDPNELKTRLDIYDNVSRAGRDMKDAFYVYAGLKLSNDDLYKAVVDPSYQSKLSEQFTKAVASNPLDYATYVTRATEAGLDRLGETVADLQKSGTLGVTATNALAQIDPNQARDLLHALATPDASSGATRALSLNELQHAFQYALLGSAASGQGLNLPTVERLEALRSAGVERAQALKGYGQIAVQQNLWKGELDRSGQDAMGESDFEKALLLNSGKEMDALQKAQGFEDSLGARTGFAAFRQSKNGQLQQVGLRPLGT